MKIIFGIGGVESHSTRWFTVAACFSLALLAGCKKDAGTDPVTAPETNSIAAEVSHAPVYTTPKTPAVVVTPAGAPDFSEMNREVRRWILRNQRPPKSFEEFAASANAQFPPPPAGKKYALDKTMHVILVKK